MRITRLYVDNYKCFVDFDFKPQAIQPIFGRNGVGKSSLFEVIVGLQELVVNQAPLKDHFHFKTLTRWKPSLIQTFILEAGIGDESPAFYTYALKLSFNNDTKRPQVHEESLRFGAMLLYSSDEHGAKVCSEQDGSSQDVLVDRYRSGVASINPGAGRQLLEGFKLWLKKVHVVSLHPSQMVRSWADEESDTLDRGGTNFVAWLRHIAQHQMSAMGQLTADLKETIEGFDSLSLEREGTSYILRAWMNYQQPDKRRTAFDFGELSDGQRVLVALYAILHGYKGTNAVLMLDEPANFLALAEIQPYLFLMRDAVGDGISQLFVVTHNAEAIDDLAPDHPALFTRGDDGSVKLVPFSEIDLEGLSASEIMTRGWEEP